MPDAYELTVSVDAADIDPLGHVNNIVYLRWVQTAATAHWRAIAPPAEQDELAWMVVRHEIDYHAAAAPGDDVILRTWIGVAVGLKFERFTEILRASDRKQLAAARTLWVPIDRKSGRPKRVSPAVRNLFSM